jgi:hypothetical protein
MLRSTSRYIRSPATTTTTNSSNNKPKKSTSSKLPTNNQPLPIGIIFEPTNMTTTTNNTTVQPDGDWRRCISCGARPCPWSKVERGTWKCVMCFKLNPLGANATMSHSSNRFEFTSNQHTVFLANKTTATDSGTVIFVIDLINATEDLTQDLDKALQDAPESLSVGLIAFENGSARIYKLGTSQRGRVISDLFSTWEEPFASQASLISSRQNRGGSSSPNNNSSSSSSMFQNTIMTNNNNDTYVAPLHQCRETLLSAVAGFKQCHSYAPIRKVYNSEIDEEPGRAIEYGLLLLESSAAASGTVIFISGSTTATTTTNNNNINDATFLNMLEETDDVELYTKRMIRLHQTMEYFSSLASRASKLNYSIEILADPSSSTTRNNSIQLLALGRVSSLPTGDIHGEGIVHSLQTLLSRCVVENWPVELRHSSNLQQAMILGCTRQVPLSYHSHNINASSCQLIRGCSLSVFFEPQQLPATDDVGAESEYKKQAFVQCVTLIPSQQHQGLLEVVCTTQFSLVDENDPHNLLIDSVDEECTAVLIAKGITATLNSSMLQIGSGGGSSTSMNNSNTNIQNRMSTYEIEETVKQLLQHKVRDIVNQANACRASTSIPRLLYHFHRSPLMKLNDGGLSTGFIHSLRARFLGAQLSDAILMMVPRLYILHVGRDVDFHIVSPSTLYLRSNYVIVCDCLDQVMIWIGNEVMRKPIGSGSSSSSTAAGTQMNNTNTTHDVNKAIKFAKQLSLSRFPAATIHMFYEGEDDERLLRIRLAPDHKHSIETLVSMVGGDLSFHQLNNLKRHLLEIPNDEPTFEMFVG